MKPITTEQALELLRSDIGQWNDYRDAGGKTPSLSGVDLRTADLSEANLFEANLSRANLSRAKLTRAKFTGAKLTGANLTGAILTRAKLSGAKLSEANLSGAKLLATNLYKANLSDAALIGADLSNADFSGANLTGSNLQYAKLKGTYLAGAKLEGAKFRGTIIDFDLSGPVGLNETAHFRESSVSIKSLRSCGEQVPVQFLRGCGLTDLEIELIPSISGKAINYYSGFISYSHKDEEFARRLYSDLQDAGVRCWYAPEDMKIGDRPLKAIEEAIRLRDKLILILSEESINSDWVEHEVTKALNEEGKREKDVLFPVRIDDAVMEAQFGWARRLREAHRPEGRHIGDFKSWKEHDAYKAAFAGLLSNLQAESPSAPK